MRQPGGDKAAGPVAVRDESAEMDGCEQAQPSPCTLPRPTLQNIAEAETKRCDSPRGAAHPPLALFV